MTDKAQQPEYVITELQLDEEIGLLPVPGNTGFEGMIINDDMTKEEILAYNRLKLRKFVNEQRAEAARAATLAARAEATQGRKIITLCGSVKFWDEYTRWNAKLTLEGNIVLSCGLSLKRGYEDLLIDLPLEDVKKDLDFIHLRKIDLSDEIFVLNVGGYIGDSTRREIGYALSKGKQVKYLESLRQQQERERG